jgi:hypothetical protein
VFLTFGDSIMHASEILIAAKQLIQDPKNHTQKEYARNKEGVFCGPASSEAVCWCSVGAVNKALGNEIYTEIDPESFLYMAASDIFNTSAVNVNDNLDHSAVMTMFDHAINLAKEAEQKEEN